MVHKARKCRGKKDCVVYGLATDSKDFWFYQVNNESMVSFPSECFDIYTDYNTLVEPYIS